MRKDTIQRKNATKGFRAATGDDWMKEKMIQIVTSSKEAFDGVMMEIGRMMAESFLLMDREEQSGPDYAPSNPHLQKWASQGGSVYIGDQKVKLQVPRLRDTALGEVTLQSYEQMKKPGQFSEELLQKLLRGISERK